MKAPSVTEQLAARFLERSLPKAEWTHEAHLRVGLWHRLNHDSEDAMNRLRTGICAYNESIGGQNTDDSGYHETITRFYVEVIGLFLKQVDQTGSMDELAEQLLRDWGRKDLPLEYYTKARLMSVEARRSWIEPDLRAI